MSAAVHLRKPAGVGGGEGFPGVDLRGYGRFFKASVSEVSGAIPVGKNGPEMHREIDQPAHQYGCQDDGRTDQG